MRCAVPTLVKAARRDKRFTSSDIDTIGENLQFSERKMVAKARVLADHDVTTGGDSLTHGGSQILKIKDRASMS
jgi:hypothetical protein